jgi:hypothetical protein
MKQARTLQASFVSKVGWLLRVALGSDKTGEIVAAVGALKRTLTSGGFDSHAFVDRVEAGIAGPRQAQWLADTEQRVRGRRR